MMVGKGCVLKPYDTTWGSKDHNPESSDVSQEEEACDVTLHNSYVFKVLKVFKVKVSEEEEYKCILGFLDSLSLTTD